jgi:1-acyl-sn-glycerol-3-phosphate acyltransferase
MGWHLRRSGQIPVVLENPKASVRSLNLAVAAIRRGNSLVIFPEGGRSPDGQLHAFMGGAFYAAVKAQVDVVPIALVGTYEMLKMNSYHIKPGPVQMVVGSPISTAGMSTRDIAKITERARQAIGRLYYSRGMVPDLRGEHPVTNEPIKL